MMDWEQELEKKFKQAEQDIERKTREIERRARRKYEESERRLGAHEAQLGSGMQTNAASAASGPPLTVGRDFSVSERDFRIDMTRERTLSGIDQIMEDEFSLRAYFDACMLAYPTIYCETVREYVEPIIADIPMSSERRTETLDRITAAAEAGAEVPFLNSLGVHIPGVGCFINGWLIGRQLGVAPREAFESSDGFALIVTTASHEKWGHGFLTEFTALGREKSSVQLGKIHLADQFEIRTVDTPDHARLSEQWRIIFTASNYVEEGYATWIERYLAERVAERQPDTAERLKHAPYFTVEGVLDRLSRTRKGKPAVAAITQLFALDTPSLPAIHGAMLEVIAAEDAMEEEFRRAVGMPAPYAVGFCIADRIAARHGAKIVPYAAVTACNIEYGLRNIANQDLDHYVRTRPELNVNTRLAAMMYVSSGKPNDIQGFLNRVKDEAGLAPPW